MKLLHTADWHLGNTFHGHNRTDEHRHFLSWLLNTIREREPDAVIVAGDIFDSANPSAVAEELLYDFVLRATLAVPGLQIVLIAGNHDSAGRLEAPAALLKTHNVYVRGAVRFAATGEPDWDYHLLPLAERASGRAACLCMAVPYVRGGDYPAGMTPEEGLRFLFDGLHRAAKRSAWADLPVVAAAHFYAAGAEVCAAEHSERLVVGGLDCTDAAVLGGRTAYAALGHIHRAQRVAGRVDARYAGSALPMSFTERNYSHGAEWVEMDAEGGTAVERLTYEPLRRLLSIPADGGTVEASQVLAEVRKLAARRSGDTGEGWPYLELRVAERQPEPTLLHEVTEALADRAARFCRMVRVRPEAEAEAENLSPYSADRRQDSADRRQAPASDPLALACEYFRSRFGEEMPEPLVSRFRRAMQAAAEEEAAS